MLLWQLMDMIQNIPFNYSYSATLLSPAMSQKCDKRSIELISHPYCRIPEVMELNVGSTCAVIVNVTQTRV